MTRILIVGATSAIATACARIWVSRQAHFFLVARDANKLQAVARDLLVRGAVQVDTYEMAAEDTEGHHVMLSRATESLGRIDVALIAHGTLPDQKSCEGDPAVALREIAINGTSVIAILTLLANFFENQRGGSIGVITSVAGDRGRRSNYVYGSAKAAVSAFCEGVRARLFRAGVSLTDVRPGFVATPMTQGLSLPAALVASPDTVAERIVRGIDRRADTLYVPAFWGAIMWVIRHLPSVIFKRLSL
jgi:decaprenylphospho-beta-D-erythro-pentofuranosid-2-ulose 2-reductase